MRRWLPLTIGVLLALLVAAALLLYAPQDDALPSEIWVLRTPEPQMVCITPGGEEVDHGSIAGSDTGVSIWCRASWGRRLLWRIGLGDPVSGVSYELTGRKSLEADGPWYHYVRVAN